jgi:hypothetical protein
MSREANTVSTFGGMPDGWWTLTTPITQSYHQLDKCRQMSEPYAILSATKLFPLLEVVFVCLPSIPLLAERHSARVYVVALH